MTSFVEKAKREFESHAKEQMSVDNIGGALYAFGSELACLRLFHKYRFNDDAYVGYSENLQSWFFRLETSYTEEQ